MAGALVIALMGFGKALAYAIILMAMIHVLRNQFDD